MTLRKVVLMRAQDMNPAQRKELGITVKKGLVAVETHNSKYTRKGVALENGVINYILTGK